LDTKTRVISRLLIPNENRNPWDNRAMMKKPPDFPIELLPLLFPGTNLSAWVHRAKRGKLGPVVAGRVTTAGIELRYGPIGDQAFERALREFGLIKIKQEDV
jgi:hypothetical protein